MNRFRTHAAIYAMTMLVVTLGRARAQEEVTLFAKDIISTEMDEFGATFTPDGRTIFFTIKSPSTLQKSVLTICTATMVNGKWSEPRIAPFSGRYKDFSPSMSPDGKQLFFISTRPDANGKRNGTDIWVTKKKEDTWSEPENLGSPINGPGRELGCSVANDGTLYFSSAGPAGSDIFSSRLVDGKYQTPDSLGSAVNSPYNETDVYISPDQRYLIFTSEGRPDALAGSGASANYVRSDLYISFRDNGHWSPAKNLGPLINTEAEESTPWVSPDGKTFYFTSEKNFVTIPMKKKLMGADLQRQLRSPGNGLGDIYSVPASVLFQK